MSFPLIANAVLQESPGTLHVPNVWGLVIAESILLIIVLVGYPWLARRGHPLPGAPPRGLNLPKGSVRSMLALTSVGTLVVVATFGAHAFTPDQHERVITILSALAGPILGFYFGSRHAESRHGQGADRPGEEESTPGTD